VQRAVGDGPSYDIGQARLSHGTAAGANLLDFGLIDVDAPDIMAISSEARRGYRADISEADNCDLHPSLLYAAQGS
jgi:hypothetical protein